ncbi:hypothetical protein FACS189440_02220 [Bacteroidia bacterium]|nr:hypothetical protein FACS189423_02090 [Bacteroidia bacterium]GHT45706.1 hypothetical protein FACS189440_02220 [Bacteroidia bacterium]
MSIIISDLSFHYPNQHPLFERLNFSVASSEKVAIVGDNGAGKTTFIQLLTGSLTPSCGQIKRADFQWIYLDQDYTQVDVDCTVRQLTEKYNIQNLKEHEVRLRLNRFLFSSDTLDKSCKALSGGEKMRLYLCCLMISNQMPDLIILDEPTNNLDISSLQVLTQTIKNYQGSLLVISHDDYFVREIGITGTLSLLSLRA